MKKVKVNNVGIFSLFIFIIIGIIILAKNKKKGRFEDLYNDTNNVDNLRF